MNPIYFDWAIPYLSLGGGAFLEFIELFNERQCT